MPFRLNIEQIEIMMKIERMANFRQIEADKWSLVKTFFILLTKSKKDSTRSNALQLQKYSIRINGYA